MSDKFVFDKTSPDADKYTEIDKFLQLTERFCKKGMSLALKRRYGEDYELPPLDTEGEDFARSALLKYKEKGNTAP